MLTCSVAQGGLITFLPVTMGEGSRALPIALLATTAGSLLGRLAAGELADRFALAGRLLRVGVCLSMAGMAAELIAGAGSGHPAAIVAGAAAVGVGFGLVQNDALLVLFAVAGPGRYGGASAAWNIAYDAGTGLGATVLGAVAQPLGFGPAFLVSL
ncbi:MAG: MFS transporter, partial [Pseudonocardiaceae bacterium]|nr:MFS transporter [Pseudonocardiaceae bacterium]